MFDLDAVVVESDDASPFPFKWGGKTFELPAFLAQPAAKQIAIIDAVSNASVDAAKLLTILRELVGDELIAELSATIGGPSNKPLNSERLVRLIGGWIDGQSPGKSPASSSSSASTAPPSKRTSRSVRGRKTS